MSSSDRREYLTATVLDQDLLNRCHDNLECRLEMVVDIETPTGTIYASDRNKYVGSTFYEALLVFPVISRTVGEWLTPEVQLSTLQLEISNADGRFNSLLAGGSDFDSWIGRDVTVRIGLAEQASTYRTIFKGQITDVGGMKRTVKSVVIVARDNYEKLSVNFPTVAFTKSAYPDIEDTVNGIIIPVIYGDYTTGLDPDPAIIPAYVLNGLNANVQGGTRNNVQCRISINDLSLIDTTNVYLRRSDVYYQVPSADVVNVGAGNKTFEVDQNTANLWVNGAAYLFEAGDEFFVRVKGKDLGSYDDNIVWQARDLLLTYGGLVSGDFNSNWSTFRDKAAISAVKSRIWENEPKPVIQYILSLLEQVRLEAFIDKDLLLKINSLHFDDFVANPSFIIKNWDVVKDSMVPMLDEANNFNRLRGVYDYHPSAGEQARRTAIFKNQDSITQVGKAISKQVEFPNLYVEADVESQVDGILKLASAMFENIDLQVTWRSLLLDVGDFVKLDVKIGSTVFDNVPCMIRTIGYDPDGLKIVLNLWSCQMLPFPGYTPGYAGTVGGNTATITEE